MLELQYSLWNSCALPSEKKYLITYFCEPWLKDHPAIRKGLLGMGMMHSHSSRTLNVKILDMCISFGHCNLALATHFLYSSM